jgi:ABC-type dipeptide/oligopeptide/nickel transport system ATPase component
MGVVGESGSGKSVMTLAMAGLLPPALSVRVGEVDIEGKPAVSTSGRRRATSANRLDIGVIFQDPRAALNPMLRVGDQLVRSLRASGVSRALAVRRSRELLDDVGIRDPKRVAESYPHELSGGMCQRIVIAMVIGAEPAMIIADEPTTGLDVTIQSQILALLRETVERINCGVLLITHDLAVAATMCDSLLVLYNGVTVEAGPTQSVLGDPLEPYTASLIASVSGTVDRGSLTDSDRVDEGRALT